MSNHNTNEADEFVKSYNRYCRQIDKEDDLVDKRINWLFMSQSLLFAALGLSSGIDSGETLLRVIPGVGFWSSLAITFTVCSASMGLIRYRWLLRGAWDDLTYAEKDKHNIRYFPQLRRSNIIISFGLIPGALIPIIFCFGWSRLISSFKLADLILI